MPDGFIIFHVIHRAWTLRFPVWPIPGLSLPMFEAQHGQGYRRPLCGCEEIWGGWKTGLSWLPKAPLRPSCWERKTRDVNRISLHSTNWADCCEWYDLETEELWVTQGLTGQSTGRCLSGRGGHDAQGRWVAVPMFVQVGLAERSSNLPLKAGAIHIQQVYTGCFPFAAFMSPNSACLQILGVEMCRVAGASQASGDARKAGTNGPGFSSCVFHNLKTTTNMGLNGHCTVYTQYMYFLCVCWSFWLTVHSVYEFCGRWVLLVSLTGHWMLRDWDAQVGWLYGMLTGMSDWIHFRETECHPGIYQPAEEDESVPAIVTWRGSKGGDCQVMSRNTVMFDNVK